MDIRRKPVNMYTAQYGVAKLLIKIKIILYKTTMYGVYNSAETIVVTIFTTAYTQRETIDIKPKVSITFTAYLLFMTTRMTKIDLTFFFLIDFSFSFSG